MLKKIKFSTENIILFILSITLVVNSILFIWFKTNFSYLSGGLSVAIATSPWHYPLYLMLLVLLIGTPLYCSRKFNWITFITKIIIATIPTEIVFLLAFRQIDSHYTPLHSIFHFLPTLWLYIATFLILHKLNRLLKINLSFSDKKTTFKKWLREQGKVYIVALGLTMMISFGFGLYNIQRAALVDEALWTFKRIPKFWENVGEKDWYSARVSDKPGLTVSAISGFGLLKIDNPKNYDSKDNSVEEVEALNFAFRFPILVFAIFMLPILYFFTERLLGKKSAIFSTIFIGLSPILLGMTRMINPDALLWIFTTTSLLAFLIFLEKKKNSALIWSGIFLGLSLLTKYVSNFLYIFFLGLIFLKYIFTESDKENINSFFKKNLFSYIVLIFISFATFFLAYPATWIKPDRILIGTIFSQAFEPILPYFAAILLITLVDTFLLKNLIFKNIFNFIAKQKQKLVWLISGIFLLFLGIIFWNAYTGNSLFDLVSTLSSPKSSYRNTTPWWFMATNFYPLIFGISPIALLLVIYFLIKSFNRKIINTFNFRVSFYLIIFILLYYVGSVFSHVSATIRYQIVLYPLILIIAGIWLGTLTERFKNKKYWLEASILSLIIILSSVLFSIKPLYFSYTSTLLPQNYHIEYKDMGVGSYEAAAYLNNLPNAKKMNIWSDKKGVCIFFTGTCFSKFDEDDFKEVDFDYYVISSGRKNLTTRKIKFMLSHSHPDTPRIDTLYSREDTEKTLNLANRPSNYIRIFSGKTLAK